MTLSSERRLQIPISDRMAEIWRDIAIFLMRAVGQERIKAAGSVVGFLSLYTSRD